MLALVTLYVIETELPCLKRLTQKLMTARRALNTFAHTQHPLIVEFVLLKTLLSLILLFKGSPNYASQLHL
jgi:hypothetical protein